RTPLAGPRRRREHRGLPRRDLPGPCARAAAGRRRHGGRRRAPRAGAWPERRGLLEGGRSAGRRAVRRRRLDALRGRKGVSTRGRRPSPTRGRSARGSLRARRRRASGTATASSIRALSWRGRSPRGPRAELRRAAEGPTMPPRCPSRWGRRTASLAKCARSSPVECPARPPARARRSRSAGADAALFIYGLEAVFFANSASSWGGHRSGSGITVGPKTMRATSACPSSPDPWHQAGRTRARAQRAPRACALQQRSLLCPSPRPELRWLCPTGEADA
ncbi:unnamed protein product, partial [Prorocentrum cordatum]